MRILNDKMIHHVNKIIKFLFGACQSIGIHENLQPDSG